MQSAKGNYAKASISVKSIDVKNQTMSFKFFVEANNEGDETFPKSYIRLRFEWTRFKFEVSPYISEDEIKWWNLEPSHDTDWLLSHDDWKFNYNVKFREGLDKPIKDKGFVTSSSEASEFIKLDSYATWSTFSLWYLDLISKPQPN